MDFSDLINRKRPTSKVSIGSLEIELMAISSKALDDLITSYPPDKEETSSAFSEDMRFELVARTISNVEISTDQVRELFDVWSRADVTKLQQAVFNLNWLGSEADKVPLSGTGSEGTPDTP